MGALERPGRGAAERGRADAGAGGRAAAPAGHGGADLRPAGAGRSDASGRWRRCGRRGTSCWCCRCWTRPNATLPLGGAHPAARPGDRRRRRRGSRGQPDRLPAGAAGPPGSPAGHLRAAGHRAAPAADRRVHSAGRWWASWPAAGGAAGEGGGELPASAVPGGAGGDGRAGGAAPGAAAHPARAAVQRPAVPGAGRRRGWNGGGGWSTGCCWRCAGLAVALLAGAFARPFFTRPLPGLPAASGRRSVLLLDVSASMRREGLWPALQARARALPGPDGARGSPGHPGVRRIGALAARLRAVGGAAAVEAGGGRRRPAGGAGAGLGRDRPGRGAGGGGRGGGRRPRRGRPARAVRDRGAAGGSGRGGAAGGAGAGGVAGRPAPAGRAAGAGDGRRQPGAAAGARAPPTGTRRRTGGNRSNGCKVRILSRHLPGSTPSDRRAPGAAGLAGRRRQPGRGGAARGRGAGAGGAGAARPDRRRWCWRGTRSTSTTAWRWRPRRPPPAASCMWATTTPRTPPASLYFLSRAFPATRTRAPAGRGAAAGRSGAAGGDRPRRPGGDDRGGRRAGGRRGEGPAAARGARCCSPPAPPRRRAPGWRRWRRWRARSAWREAPAGQEAVLTQVDLRDPLLAPFADGRASDFTRVRFWKRRLVDAAALPAGARVLARFDDGSPAWLVVADRPRPAVRHDLRLRHRRQPAGAVVEAGAAAVVAAGRQHRHHGGAGAVRGGRGDPAAGGRGRS